MEFQTNEKKSLLKDLVKGARKVGPFLNKRLSKMAPTFKGTPTVLFQKSFAKPPVKPRMSIRVVGREEFNARRKAEDAANAIPKAMPPADPTADQTYTGDAPWYSKKLKQ